LRLEKLKKEQAISLQKMNAELTMARKRKLEDECADVFSSLLSVCDSYGIDLESTYERIIDKIEGKIPEWREK
jgi:NTP pyrophosphatase (non-canonical NTP hydrolase)